MQIQGVVRHGTRVQYTLSVVTRAWYENTWSLRQGNRNETAWATQEKPVKKERKEKKEKEKKKEEEGREKEKEKARYNTQNYVDKLLMSMESMSSISHMYPRDGTQHTL